MHRQKTIETDVHIVRLSRAVAVVVKIVVFKQQERIRREILFSTGGRVGGKNPIVVVVDIATADRDIAAICNTTLRWARPPVAGLNANTGDIRIVRVNQSAGVAQFQVVDRNVMTVQHKDSLLHVGPIGKSVWPGIEDGLPIDSPDRKIILRYRTIDSAIGVMWIGRNDVRNSMVGIHQNRIPAAGGVHCGAHGLVLPGGAYRKRGSARNRRAQEQKHRQLRKFHYFPPETTRLWFSRGTQIGPPEVCVVEANL